MPSAHTSAAVAMETASGSQRHLLANADELMNCIIVSVKNYRQLCFLTKFLPQSRRGSDGEVLRY